MKKISKWMNEKNYSKDDYQDYFEEVIDLSKVGKHAQLIHQQIFQIYNTKISSIVPF
ncbi:hypothetical protein MHI02_03910 [Oceanobacillus sp. FSL K6-0118]